MQNTIKTFVGNVFRQLPSVLVKPLTIMKQELKETRSSYLFAGTMSERETISSSAIPWLQAQTTMQSVYGCRQPDNIQLYNVYRDNIITSYPFIVRNRINYSFSRVTEIYYHQLLITCASLINASHVVLCMSPSQVKNSHL